MSQNMLSPTVICIFERWCLCPQWTSHCYQSKIRMTFEETTGWNANIICQGDPRKRHLQIWDISIEMEKNTLLYCFPAALSSICTVTEKNVWNHQWKLFLQYLLYEWYIWSGGVHSFLCGQFGFINTERMHYEATVWNLIKQLFVTKQIPQLLPITTSRRLFSNVK